MTVSGLIKDKAAGLGFDCCGIARSRPLDEHMERLSGWLEQGRNAGMSYMANHFKKRLDPSLLFEGAKSVVVCLSNYKTDAAKGYGIASYAFYEDYHYPLRQAASALSDYIKEIVPGSNSRAFVDTAPILERAWAVEAGLGWIGRNSVLINPDLGSFVFIAVVITDAELEYDTTYIGDGCGSCHSCIETCPVGAIADNRTIDARRCLSYHTIESRQPIPDDIAGLLGDTVFGCDACQDACPWNRKIDTSPSVLLTPTSTLVMISEDEWIKMEKDEFLRRFGNSPLSRAGLKKIKTTITAKKMKS